MKQNCMEKLNRKIFTVVMGSVALLMAVWMLLGNDIIARAEAVSGTYVPYEGAKYSLTYTMADSGITITGIADYETKNDLGELVIPEEIDGVPVTGIGYAAFNWCSGFEGELSIPGSVGFIGEHAFSGCSGLTGDLIIPDSVTSLGDYAFYCCGFDGELKISTNLTSIGEGVFSYCDELVGSLIIPEGVTVIGKSAFCECSSLSGDLTIPDSVTSIGESAFYFCEGFDGELSISDNVITIGNDAFYWCTDLTGELKIPDGVTSIGNYAFYYCIGFDGSLTIPNSVSSIGTGSFGYCSGLTDIIGWGNLTEIPQMAFYECDGLASVSIFGNITKIAGQAFGECDNLLSIDIGCGVQVIENKAFYSSKTSGEKKIVFHGLNTQMNGDIGVDVIYGYTIYGYPGSTAQTYAEDHGKEFVLLEYGALYDGKYVPYEGAKYSLAYTATEGGIIITGIEDYVSKENLGELVIPSEIEGVEVIVIKEAAFADCSGFTGTLQIPYSVTAMGRGAFENCSGFIGITSWGSITEIPERAFIGCEGLTYIEIDGKKIVGASAFESCDKLLKVVVKEYVQEVGEKAFYSSNIEGSQRLYFYGSDTVINGEVGGDIVYGNAGSTAESYAESHSKVFALVGNNTLYCYTPYEDADYYFNYNLTEGGIIIAHINGSLNRVDYCGDLIIPSEIDGVPVVQIGKSAFEWCRGFSGDLIIPAGVKFIDSSAFYFCSGLDGNLIIPDSTTYIDENAFIYCSNILGVCFKGNAISNVSFLYTLTEEIPVYYPASKSGWEEVVAANPDINWVMYDGEVPDFGPVATATPVPTATPTQTPSATVTPAPTTAPSNDVEEQVSAFVSRMYTVALGRDAEQGGLEYWTASLLAGENDGAGIAKGFLLSEEFVGMGYDNEEYVKTLYGTFFDRVPADEEVAYWVDTLMSDATKEMVLSGFVNSEEFFNLCSSYGISRGVMYEDGCVINPGIGRFAERLYTKVLERAGEEEGVEYWAIAIANGDCAPEHAAKSFFNSDEYLAKQSTDGEYVKALYRTFMDRECDQSGLEFWIGELGSGKSRDAVLDGFAYSEEFKEIIASFGL